MQISRGDTRGRRSSKYNVRLCATIGRKPMLLEQNPLGRRWEEMRSGKEPNKNVAL